MPEAAGLMRGKRGLIMGVANNRSIAWGIAQGLPRAGRGARLHLSGRRAEEAGRAAWRRSSAGSWSAIATSPRPSTIDAVFAAVAEKWGALDFVVHAIAFSDKDELDRPLRRHDGGQFLPRPCTISCYSFTAVAQRAEKLMPHGGSLLTLTYYGAEKWMPHYNVMGVAKAALEASVRYLAADLGAKNIRVNAISAGPIKTLAASGIGDFRYILKWNELNSPLRRTVTIEEVGDTAVYFLSDLVARRDRRDPSCRRRLSHRRHEASRRARHRGREGMRRVPVCCEPDDVTPVLYYVRHGLTDWNIAAAPAGPARRAAQRRRPRAGGALRRHPARSVRARRPRAGGPELRVEPARARPRDHGNGARDARPAARRTIASSRGSRKSRSATGKG